MAQRKPNTHDTKTEHPRRIVTEHPHPFISCGNTKRDVAELLAKGLSLRMIASRLHKSVSTIAQHKKELRGRLPQETEVFGSSSRSTPGVKFTPQVTSSQNRTPATTIFSDRAHDISLKYNLIHKGQFKSNLKAWKQIKLKNVTLYGKYIAGWYVRYTGKSLILNVPNIWATTSEEAIGRAKELSIQFLQRNAESFEGLLIGGIDYKCEVISQHHAIVEHPIAKEFKQANQSYRDDRIMIDASNDTPELEFIHSKEGQKDHKKYTEFANDIIRNDSPKLSELTEQLKEIDVRISTLVQTQINTQRQLETFIKINTPSQPTVTLDKVDYFG